MYESDPRSNEHFLCSSENKVWKKQKKTKQKTHKHKNQHNDQLPVGLLAQLGGARNRYRRGHGFKSSAGLK